MRRGSAVPRRGLQLQLQRLGGATWVRCIPRDSCPGNFVAPAASTATAAASTAASSTRSYETYRRGKPRCNDSDFVPITRRCFRAPRDELSAHPTAELIPSILTPIVTGVNFVAIYNYILKKICSCKTHRD